MTDQPFDETDEARGAAHPNPSDQGLPEPGAATDADETAGPSEIPLGEVPEGVTVPDDVSALDGMTNNLAEGLLADLQRVQAEYVNYRKRVDRDREVAKERAHAAMLEALLPVLDDIELARQHGDLVGGPFAAIADKLEGALGRYGLARYGDPGTPFDPAVHEALLHSESEEVAEPTVTQVLQPGYMIKDRVLRAARVAVSAPA